MIPWRSGIKTSDPGYFIIGFPCVFKRSSVTTSSFYQGWVGRQERLQEEPRRCLQADGFNSIEHVPLACRGAVGLDVGGAVGRPVEGLMSPNF